MIATPGPPDEGIRRQRLERLAVPGLLFFALAYRLWGLTGDMHFDPIVYAQNAYNLLQGTFTLKTDSWFAHRWTVFLPVAPCYALGGVGSLTSRIWPLLASLVQLVMVLFVGRRLYSRGVALLAGLIVALAPLDVIYAGVLNPDPILAAFLTGAAGFWILALEGRERPARRLLLLSGLCFALALVTRENAAVLLFFYLGYVVWRRPPVSAIGWTFLGALFVAVPLLTVYGVSTGDPFYRLGVVTGRYGTGAKSEGTQFLFYPSLLWHVRHSQTGVLPLLAALSLVCALVRPRRAHVVLLLWILPLLIYLQLGTMSLSQYIPILKRERFLTPLMAPLALLIAATLPACLRNLLARVFPRRPGLMRPILGAALGMTLLVLAVNSLGIVREHRARGTRAFEAFQATVDLARQEPDLPVLFDHWRTGYRFSYYFGFEEGADFYRGGDDRSRMGRPGSFGPSRLGYLAWYPDAELLPHAFVVLDDEALSRLAAGDSVTQTYVAGEVPAYAFSPPPSWQLLGRFGSFRIYRTASP